ncbi:hypothetical protein BC629DRAFT_1537461 [Irpex lacteus]|nr:hypothetical protein BC629DRAFT_1537461 [Irpex lacteus]
MRGHPISKRLSVVPRMIVAELHQLTLGPLLLLLPSRLLGSNGMYTNLSLSRSCISDGRYRYGGIQLTRGVTRFVRGCKGFPLISVSEVDKCSCSP